MVGDTKQFRVSAAEMKQFQTAIATDPKCGLAGDLRSGRLSYFSPFGPIEMSYNHDGAHSLTIVIDRAAPFMRTSMIFNEIGLKIQQAAAMAK